MSQQTGLFEYLSKLIKPTMEIRKLEDLTNKDIKLKYKTPIELVKYMNYDGVWKDFDQDIEELKDKIISVTLIMNYFVDWSIIHIELTDSDTIYKGHWNDGVL